jgi:hypothetical protein
MGAEAVMKLLMSALTKKMHIHVTQERAKGVNIRHDLNLAFEARDLQVILARKFRDGKLGLEETVIMDLQRRKSTGAILTEHHTDGGSLWLKRAHHRRAGVADSMGA